MILFAAIWFWSAAPLEMKCPDECVIGELVRIECNQDVSWQIIPENKDFAADGKRAYFSSRSEGEYTIIAVGDKRRSLVKKLKVVGVAEPLAAVLKKIKGTKEEAIKLAQSFRALSKEPIDIEATAAANRVALGKNLDAWKPFLDYLGENIEPSHASWLKIAGALDDYSP